MDHLLNTGGAAFTLLFIYFFVSFSGGFTTIESVHPSSYFGLYLVSCTFMASFSISFVLSMNVAGIIFAFLPAGS